MSINRRSLITGLISFIAAPAIVRASSLMPVKMIDNFDPKEVMTRIINYVSDDLVTCLDPVCDPTKLFWINNIGKIVMMPIEDSNCYLDNLND